MSLDVTLYAMRMTDVYTDNITHNLHAMAEAVVIGEKNLYLYLWHADDESIKYARDLIQPLTDGLRELLAHPDKYIQYNPSNGWGDYEGLVKFTRDYRDACEANPDAEIDISR